MIDIENKFNYLLSSCIPSEDSVDDDTFITNFYDLKRLVNGINLKNHELILYEAVEYFAQVDGALRKEFLYSFMVNRVDHYLKHKDVKINEIVPSEQELNLNLYGDYEIAQKMLMSAIVNYYDSIRDLHLDRRDFNSLIKIYADELFNRAFEDLQRQCAIITREGLLTYRGGQEVMLRGADDAHHYYITEYSLLESKFKLDDEEYIDSQEDATEQLKKLDKFQEAMFNVVADTGIKPIDDSLKGFRRTQLLGIEAGAGVGKSSFARWIAYRGLVMNKQNVLDITMEQQYTEITAMYVSMHLYTKYNVWIAHSDIKKNNIPDDLRDVYRIARFDLLTNPDYGKIRIVAKDLYVEDAFEYLAGMKRSTIDYDILILDYSSLFGSKAEKKYGTTNLHEIVTEVYKRTKRDICRKLKVFAIVINQLSKEGVKALAKGEQSTTYDASNSGETYKSADANLVLSSNQQLESEGKLRITSPKFRDAKKFHAVYVEARLPVCVFEYSESVAISDDEYNEALGEAS